MLQTLGLLAGLSLLGAAPADDKPTEARTVLDAAVKALGGRDKLAKLPATTFNSEGYLLLSGNLRVTSKSTWSVQYPDKYRYDGKISSPPPPPTPTCWLSTAARTVGPSPTAVPRTT